MTRRLALLIGGSLAFWVLVAYPGLLLGGRLALAYSGVAMALCLVPATATLLWSDYALRGSPEAQLILVMGGIGLRMAVVLGAGLILFYSVPYFQKQSFWIWILVTYLFVLTLEMGLMLAGAADRQSPGHERQ